MPKRRPRIRCPACGQPTDERLIVYPSGGGALIDGEAIPMLPRAAVILELLNRQWGHVTHGRTIAGIIGMTENSVKATVYNLRRAIYYTKLVVDARPGPEGGYWLRWLPER